MFYQLVGIANASFYDSQIRSSNQSSLEPTYDKTQVDIRLFNILYCTSKRKTGGSPHRHLRPTRTPVNYGVFLCVVLKNIVFYGVLWLSACRNFFLALLKNHAFYVVLGFKGCPGTEKMTRRSCFEGVRQNLSTRWGDIGAR